MRKEQWTGAVLAGGRSSRMGLDKALMPFGERTLLEHALELLRPHVAELLVIGDPARYGALHDRVLPDDVPGKGPLGGIATALDHARHGCVLVLGCDMPGVTTALLSALKEGLDSRYDAFVPACDGSIEPLVAAYHKRCLPVFAERLSHDRLKLSDALAQVRTRYVQICPGEDGWPTDLFRNLNAPSDL